MMIPGTADVPTARVASAGLAYCQALAAWQAQQKITDELRAELIRFAKEDGIQHFVLEHYDVIVRTTATTKIAVKTLDKE